MRTEKYSRYLTRMMALCGVDSLLASEEAHFLEYFQRNIRYAWGAFEWPDLCVTESRIPDDDGAIESVGGGDSDIGEILAVWDGDPSGTASVGEVNYSTTGDGLSIWPRSSTELWIYFRKRIPDYYGAPYVSTTTYAIDGQTYYPTTGNFYRALVETTGNLPTDTANWEELEIPYCLFEFVVQSSFADALLAEGFSEKSSTERAKAEGWLLQEIENVERRQRQHHRHNVMRTHGTTQAR